MARLAPEVANVEAMFGRSIAENDGMVRAVYGWAELVRFTGLGSTGTLEQIARHAVAVGLPRVAAHSFESLGDIALNRSDAETARAWCEEAQPLYHQIGDVLGEANCILSLGEIALHCLDYEAAQARYEEALPLFRQIGHMLGEANCIAGLGHIAGKSSQYDVAQTQYDQALPLYRQAGDVLGEANCVMSLGDLAFAKGDRASADSQYRAALTLYERIATRYSIGAAHLRLARSAADDTSRAVHVAAARAAWRSIKRDDLVAEYLDAEFGAG